MVLVPICVGVIGAAVLLYKYGITFILDVSAGETGIEFKFFHCLTVASIRYDNIDAVVISSWFDIAWFRGNVLGLFRILTIGVSPRSTKLVLKLKRGIFSYVVIFLREPEVLAQEIRSHL